MDMIKIMGKGDISKETYDDVVTLYLRSSRGPSRRKTLVRDASSRVQKSFKDRVMRT